MRELVRDGTLEEEVRMIMTIDVPTPYEEIIRKAVASGAFKSPEEAVRHALVLLEREQQAIETSKLVNGDALPDDLDPDLVARAQGVGPIRNPDEGAEQSWLEDEDFEGWIADLRRLRGHGLPREIS